MNSGGPSRGSDLLDGSFTSDICKRRSAIRNVHRCGGKKNFAGKDLHIPKGRRFQAIFGVNCSRDAEAKRNRREKIFKPRRAGGFRRTSIQFVRRMRRQGEIRGQSCSKAEGREVSGEHRFGLFVECGGEGKCAVKSIYMPKGRACQEKIG